MTAAKLEALLDCALVGLTSAELAIDRIRTVAGEEPTILEDLDNASRSIGDVRGVIDLFRIEVRVDDKLARAVLR